MNNRKLKNYLIKKDVQLKIAISNLIYMLLMVAVIVLTILSPLYLDIFQSVDLCNQYFSANIFIILLERLAFTLVVLLILAFVHQIVLTHKFCGPLVNFAKTFKKVSEGDLTRKIFLRRYDFLQNEATQVNEMIDGLSGLVEKIKKENSLLLSMLEEATGSGKAADKTDAVLKKAAEHANECRQHLAKFIISKKFDGEPN
ncbi:MAG: methyl-accepting chemotaxis protein [Desulfobacterales bacterium]